MFKGGRCRHCIAGDTLRKGNKLGIYSCVLPSLKTSLQTIVHSHLTNAPATLNGDSQEHSEVNFLPAVISY